MCADHWFLPGQPESQPHKQLATKQWARDSCWRGDSWVLAGDRKAGQLHGQG